MISPLLANIYLHYVLDLWFETEVRPRLRGRASLVRYADDAVMVFESEAEARQVFEALPGRMADFGLRLHPEKTRLIPFRQPPPAGPPRGVRPSQCEGRAGPGSFDFLGFTHFWGRSLRGFFVVQRRTSKKSFRRALRSTWEWCRSHRHDPISRQRVALGVKLLGHFRYFGLSGNWRQLSSFAQQVRRAWRYWLARRSSKASMPWDRFNRLLKHHPLPSPRIYVPSAASP